MFSAAKGHKQSELFGFSAYLLYLCATKKPVMNFSSTANMIFNGVISDYHLTNSVDAQIKIPYDIGSIERELYQKCWIDTVQWHLEDLIRDPNISPADALLLKQRIDKSNQDRIDLVEQIDSHFRTQFSDVTPLPEATLNTESPAWAVDRLSILALKIYHMREQTARTDAPEEHITKCKGKLAILLEQQIDLSKAIDQLLDDIAAGRKRMKVFRKIKIYNYPPDDSVLYAKKIADSEIDISK